MEFSSSSGVVAGVLFAELSASSQLSFSFEFATWSTKMRNINIINNVNIFRNLFLMGEKIDHFEFVLR